MIGVRARDQRAAKPPDERRNRSCRLPARRVYRVSLRAETVDPRSTIFGRGADEFCPPGDNFGTPYCETQVNQQLARSSLGWEVRADCLLRFLTDEQSLSILIGTQIVLPMIDVS